MAIVQAAIIGSAAGNPPSGYPIPGSGVYDVTFGDGSLNGTPYNPGSGQSSVGNSDTGFYRRSVNGEWYTGSYSATDMTFFHGKTVKESIVDSFVSFGSQLDVNSYYSMYWLGYFQAPETGTYNISISSDDNSMVWIGSNAISGFTGSNCVVTAGNTTANSLSLTGGQWYPIRIWYDEHGGNNSCQLFIGQTGYILHNMHYWSLAGRVAYDRVTKGLNAPSYIIAPTSNSVNEGIALTFNISTGGLQDGTKLYYDITSTGSYTITRDRFGLPGSARFVRTYPNGQYLSTNVTAPGTDSITYEWWFYQTTSTGAQGMLQTRTNTVDGDGIDVGVYEGAISITTSGTVLFSGGSININTWYHIALVRTGTTTFSVYLNGTSLGTFEKTGLTGTELSIGRKSASGYNEFFDGYITNFRYVKGTAVYTENFVPLPSPLAAISGTELLLLENNSAGLLTDSSVHSVVVTNNNSVVWNRLSPLKLSFVVTNNTGSFDITTSADLFTATGTQLYTVTLSTDGINSVGNTVSVTVNDTSLTRPQWHDGDATASGINVSYRYYKFHITKVKDQPQSNDATQISELIILNGSTRLTGGTATNPNGTQAFVSEIPSKVLSGYYDDKWCDVAFGSNSNTSTLIIDYGTAQTSNGFIFATANDAVGRDPVQWTFEGSNDGSAWTVLQEQTTDASITNDRNTLISTPFNYPLHGSAVINYIYPTELDYVSLPALPDWNLGTTWTVEFWLYMNSASDNAGVHQQGGIWGLLNQHGWAVVNGINIALSGGFLQVGNGPSTNNTVYLEPTPQQWVHVAIVNNSGTKKVFYNGFEQVSDYRSGSGTSEWTNSTSPLYIGSLGDYAGGAGYGGSSFYGKMTNLRITDRAEYTANFHPPAVLPTKITNHTRLLWTPTDQALTTDTSDNPHTITNGGVTFSSDYPTTTPDNTRGSAIFDGSTNRYYKVPGGSNTQLGTTWTIEWWQKSTAATAGNGQLYTVMSQAPGGGRIDIYYQSGNLVIQNGQTLCAEPPVGVWVHVAIVNNAGSGTVYYNGIAQSASGNFGNYGQTQDLYIGKRGDNPFQFFNGKLTNIRITDTAVYTGSFNPTALPALISGHTKLLLTPTADTIYGVDSGDLALSLSSSGIRYSSDYPVVVLPQSLSFANDMPYMGMSPGYAFGTGAFTIQGWTKFTSAIQGGLVSTNGTVGAMACGFVNATNFFIYIPGVGPTATFTVSPAITTGSWHHFALVRDGSSHLALFIDGTRTGYDASHTSNYYAASDYLFNGVGAIGSWDTAKLADFQVSNTNLFDPTQTSITVPFPNLYATAGVTKLLLDGKVSKTTDAAGVQTVTQYNGTITLSSDFPV